MALKNLTVEEMVSVSGAWTDASNAGHEALQQQPRLAAFLGDLQTVHEDIVAVVPGPNKPREAEIVELAAQEDALHDTLARGIHGMLTHLALLQDDGSVYIELRDELMPAGLAKTIQATYRGQAGWTYLLRERLMGDSRKALEGIPLPDGRNLFATVDAWLDAGARLGKLEEERARLAEGKSLAAQVVSARNQWIRLVNTLLSLAEWSELDEEAERVIFGPLQDAESTADQRAARRSSDAVAPEPVGSD